MQEIPNKTLNVDESKLQTVQRKSQKVIDSKGNNRWVLELVVREV